jgi:hypothetical protein
MTVMTHMTQFYKRGWAEERLFYPPPARRKMRHSASCASLMTVAACPSWGTQADKLTRPCGVGASATPRAIIDRCAWLTLYLHRLDLKATTSGSVPDELESKRSLAHIKSLTHELVRIGPKVAARPISGPRRHSPRRTSAGRRPCITVLMPPCSRYQSGAIRMMVSLLGILLQCVTHNVATLAEDEQLRGFASARHDGSTIETSLTADPKIST